MNSGDNRAVAQISGVVNRVAALSQPTYLYSAINILREDR